MLRRKFIGNLVLLAGGLLAGQPVLAKDKKLRGRVLSKGKGIKNVVVSDGFSVVATDAKGRYEFEPHALATAIFISTPAGYAFKNEAGISRHYRLLTDVDQKKELLFDLVPLDKNDNEHQFIIWADPQVKNKKDVDKMMAESVPDAQKIIASAGAGALMHGITVGDIVWDAHELFADYETAVAKMGIPFFQCLGNHDMDLNKGGDDASDDTFQRLYGPTYYSFNRGQVHYVVMDNVRYLGKDKQYDGYFVQEQLDWLQKDLEFVSKDKLVILCVHIPVHTGTKNRDMLYPILKDRKVHIMSGHTHYNRNTLKEGIYEHNHGTVCGAWWTGPICEDGTPNGYGVYKVKGTELEWHYQSTGHNADHQLKIFVNEKDGAKEMVANIWNYDAGWQTEYLIDGVSKGKLEQFEGVDPLAYSTMLGPDLPKSRTFAEPKKTDHLFRASVPAGAKSITVKATDRFGRISTETYNLA